MIKCLLTGLPGTSIGQNIYFSSSTIDPVAGINVWESEKVNFNFGASNVLEDVGHYTQVNNKIHL